MPNKFLMKYPIEQKFLTCPSKRRSGTKMPSVTFMVAHDTGNPGSTADQNVKYYQNSCHDMSASAHLFVDDKKIIECVPFLTATPEKAWHVLYNVDTDNTQFGDDANDVAGGVEWCYGGKIDLKESYKRFVWVMAYACYKHKIDPLKEITGHYLLDPKRKTDPQKPLQLLKKTLDDFKKDVAAEMKACLSS